MERTKQFHFNNHGYCATTTKSGKSAAIYRVHNAVNFREYYTLYIDRKMIFSRGTLEKVAATIDRN